MRHPKGSIGLVGLLVACSSGGGSPSSSSSARPPPKTAPSVAALASSTAPAASHSPSATSTAIASASASAGASASVAAEDAPSSEPELAEWGKARFYPVGGARDNGCETKMVREWLRVLCPQTPDLGEPDKIVIIRGRKPNEYYKGENLKNVAHIVTLVQPLRRGVDFEARFEWANGSRVLTATFRADAKAPNADFDNKPAETAAADASGSKPNEPPQPTLPEPPLDDLVGLEPPPSDADWDAAKKLELAGSFYTGCETTVIRSWSRTKCTKKPIVAVEFEQGHYKTQSTASVVSGVGTLVTPRVEETDTWVRFQFRAQICTEQKCSNKWALHVTAKEVMWHVE